MPRISTSPFYQEKREEPSLCVGGGICHNYAYSSVKYTAEEKK